MGINIPGSCNRTGFVAFSNTVRNSQENLSISQVAQSAIGWEFHEKENQYFGKKYGYLYSSSLP